MQFGRKITPTLITFLAMINLGKPCPTACTCYHSEGMPTADCREQALKEVPSNIPSDVMTLHMGGNNLGKIRKSKYFVRRNLENLVSLYLPRCNITEIGSKTFSGLSILGKIDLSSNLLEEIPDRAFSGLTRLRSVDLSYNLLIQIEAKTFSGAPLLRTINLSYNRIKYVLNDAFEGLMYLEKIRLQGNRLFQLEKTPFFRMQQLQVLNLVENPWRCDCYLRSFVKWQSGKYLTSPPECFQPGSYRGKRWDKMTLDEFACPPKFYGHRQNTNRNVKSGSAVTFSCPLAGADPPPLVTWKFRPENSSEKTILDSRPGKIIFARKADNLKPNAWNYTLTILSISANDEGRYQCTGKNKAGYEHETFDLDIITPDPSFGQVTVSGSHLLPVDLKTDGDSSDLWLIIVVVCGVFLIVLVLLVIGIYYRKSHSPHGAKNFKSVNGYGYQVIEGGFTPTDKAQQQHYIEDCYLPNPGISYSLPPPHSDKQTLTRPLEPQLPQDDSGYLEAPLDPPQNSPRGSQRRSNLPHQGYASGGPEVSRINNWDNEMTRRQNILRNGKAPLAQQEKADNMKMPLRETAL